MRTQNIPSSAAPAEHSHFSDSLRLGLVALVYASVFTLALSVRGGKSTLATIWPASGVGLAVLLLNSRRRWGAILAVIFAASSIISLLLDRLNLTSVCFIVVSMTEMWTCASVMTRRAGNRVTFARAGDVLALATCAFVVNGVFALIGASVATAASNRSFKEWYLTWWISNGLGILLVTPLVIAHAEPWRRYFTARWPRQLEAVSLGLVSFACAWLGFHRPIAILPIVPQPYWIFMPLVWAALRFGVKGATMVLFVVTVIAIYLSLVDQTEFPLGGGDFSERLHMVQFFLAVAALTGLALAAVVDERQSAKKTLSKLSRIVEQAPLSIIITSLTGAIEYVNPRFCAVTGYTPEEALGRNTRILKSDETSPESYRNLWQTIGSGQPWTGDLRNRRKNGEVYLESAVIAPVADENGRITHYVAFNDDVTAQRRFEAESRSMLQKEREASEMKTRFISMTSHEFRTPMAAAMGWTELLHNHFERLTTEKREELFNRIKTSFQQMTLMLDDVLTLSRMDAIRVEVRLGSIDLSRFLQDVLDEIQLANRQAHRFEARIPADFPDFVTDARLLHQVLSNLLGNAMRYSPPGTLIVLGVEADAQSVRLWVADQGIGIPPADRSRIFQPFERGSNVGAIEGTGLGLNIVKRMAELLGGSINIDSVEGEGSRFTLVHPRLVLPADAENP